MHTQESASKTPAPAKVSGEGSSTDRCDTLPLPDTQLMEHETFDHEVHGEEEECEEEACTEDEEVDIDQQIPKHEQNMVDVAPDSLLEIERKALGGEQDASTAEYFQESQIAGDKTVLSEGSPPISPTEVETPEKPVEHVIESDEEKKGTFKDGIQCDPLESKGNNSDNSIRT